MNAPLAPVKLWSMTLPIRWGDMDARNHVNNAEYMRYFEEARVSWSQARGLRNDSSSGFIIAKASIDYHAPLDWPGQVESEIFTARIGNSSFALRQTLTAQGSEHPAATAEFVVVWFDYGAGRAAPIPPALRAVLEGQDP
ncbi:MAG TPA: thioesterase family protein [Usitatibacteraceae bacterium]|nr:thioesterase family protein [Usitatibacteraceae bacterium]